MLARVGRLPTDRWQHCQITQSKRKRRPIQYVDEWVKLDDYEGAVRQLIVTGLGHESPTFFLTNDLPQPQTRGKSSRLTRAGITSRTTLVSRSRFFTSIACAVTFA